MQNNTLRPPTIGIGPFPNGMPNAARFIHFTFVKTAGDFPEFKDLQKIQVDVVKVNSVYPVTISTVQLYDLYETVIFDGKLHGITRHYDSLDDAKKGHQDAVMSVRKAEWS